MYNSDARHRPRRRISTGLERGRRPAAGAHFSGAMREEDGPPAGHSGDPEHTTGAGPDLRGPAPTGRTKDDRTDSGADERRRCTARPLARAVTVQPARAVTRERPPGRGLMVTQTRSTRCYLFADSHQASKPGELGLTRNQPGCGCRTATSCPWRNGDSAPAGHPARGGCDSSTAAQPWAATPGSPHTRGHPDRGPQAGRGTDPAQWHPRPHRLPSRGGDATLHRRPNPRAAASQPRSTRPLAQADSNPPPAQRRL
jgi:hypothetical protein